MAKLLSGRVDWDRLAKVLQHFGHEMSTYERWGGVWLAFLMIVALGMNRLKRHFYLLLISLLNMAAVIFEYYSTPEFNPLSWWLETGFDRMILHFFPLVIFTAALLTQKNGAYKGNP